MQKLMELREEFKQKQLGTERSVLLLLPQHVLEHVFCQLPLPDVGRVARVCKEWQKLVSEGVLLWKKMVRTTRTHAHAHLTDMTCTHTCPHANNTRAPAHITPHTHNPGPLLQHHAAVTAATATATTTAKHTNNTTKN